MKVFGVTFVLCCVVISALGVPFPATKDKGSPVVAPLIIKESSEVNTTAPPWLKFLKNKKTTTIATTIAPPVQLLRAGAPVPSVIASHPGTRAIASNAGPAMTQTSSLDQVLDKLAAYFNIQPDQYLTGDAIAQDKKANPDTLYDNLYLDWMKREAESEPNQATPAPQIDYQVPPNSPEYAQQVPMAQQPVSSPMYSYPSVPLTYGPFFPSLAGFKVQKAMAQAQFDAALASLSITTTPKPIKLKLKIQIPGLTDLTQLGQITSSLSAILPPGSTLELD